MKNYFFKNYFLLWKFLYLKFYIQLLIGERLLQRTQVHYADEIGLNKKNYFKILKKIVYYLTIIKQYKILFLC